MAFIKGPIIGARHMQALLLFLLFIVTYMGRLNVSVAVVAMTNAATTNPNFDEYDWTEREKSYILSSFYWGYVLTQFTGCYMSRKFGAKLTILISTLGWSLLSMITPACLPSGGWQAYFGIRVLQGMFQGLSYPCVHDHLAKWSPIEERTRLGALSHTGMEIGTILAMAVTGLIAESSMGWPGISYVSGAMGLAWCLLWMILADNGPSVSRFISTEEKKYILASQQKVDMAKHKKIPVPWKAILTSVPFISLIIVRIAEAWSYSTVQAEIPSYLRGVLDMDIRSNALYSSLPFLAMFLLSYVYLIAADILIKKKVLSLTNVRKTFSSIAMWIPAGALIWVGFLGENDKPLAIALMTVTIGINAGVTIGSALNTIDLSPNHAGMLMGVINTATSAISLITPLFVGVIVHDASDRTLWQIVFAISAVVFFVGNLQFICLGTTKTQPWNAEDFLLNKHIESGIDNAKPKDIAVDSVIENDKPIDSHITYVE